MALAMPVGSGIGWGLTMLTTESGMGVGVRSGSRAREPGLTPVIGGAVESLQGEVLQSLARMMSRFSQTLQLDSCASAKTPRADRLTTRSTGAGGTKARSSAIGSRSG